MRLFKLASQLTRSHRFSSSFLPENELPSFLINKIVVGNCRKEKSELSTAAWNAPARYIKTVWEWAREARKAFSVIVKRVLRLKFLNCRRCFWVLCKLENWIPLCEIKLCRKIYLLFALNFAVALLELRLVRPQSNSRDALEYHFVVRESASDHRRGKVER